MVINIYSYGYNNSVQCTANKLDYIISWASDRLIIGQVVCIAMQSRAHWMAGWLPYSKNFGSEKVWRIEVQLHRKCYGNFELANCCNSPNLLKFFTANVFYCTVATQAYPVINNTYHTYALIKGLCNEAMKTLSCSNYITVEVAYLLLHKAEGYYQGYLLRVHI